MNQDVNTITVMDHTLLLVATGGAEAHLAAESGADGRRAAVNVHRSEPGMPPEQIPGYDQAALHHERWSPTTLCGRDWVEMAAGEGSVFRRWQEVTLAPTCRSCLRVVDKWFPESDAPNGLDLLASIVADKVEAFGSSRVFGVPAEHIEKFRRAARKSLRARGYRSETHVVNAVVHVLSDDAYAAIDPANIKAQEERITEALSRIHSGGSPEVDPGDPPDSVRWSTWVVDL